MISKKIFILFLAAVFPGAAACSSKADKPPKVAQQEPAPSLEVEKKEEAREPEKKQPTVLTLAALEQIYACWFKNPYDYMFASAGVPGEMVGIGGKNFAMFMGGISGIMDYGSLSECAGGFVGVKQKSYSDPTPIEHLAGIPLYSERMDDSQPFGFFNPELVKWGYTTMIPDPDSLIGGAAAQIIYDKVFKRFARVMAESYLYLVDSGKYRDEMKAYWDLAKKPGGFKPYGYGGLDYLQSRFNSALPAYQVAWDGTKMTPQMAIGFWLRRGLDGTHEELWTGLTKALKQYDGVWYDSLKTTYTSANIHW